MNWLETPWSLKRLIRQDEAAWFAFNKYRQNFGFSSIEQELLFAGEHPLRFSVSVLAILLALLVLGAVLPDDWLAARWVGWGVAEQLSYFTAIWSVQATLAALVYPIVIAFVTVFLQRRPAAEAFIHLYVLHSGALVAGLSSLALVVVMAVQYGLLPSYGASALPAWAALDAVWFLLNAALTTFFLYRTIEFLRPDVQDNVVRKYTINVALPRDIQRLSGVQLMAQAQSKGWIPAPDYLDDKNTEGPKVLLRYIGLRDGEILATIALPHPSRLVDVRFWPLRFVVTSWLRAAKSWPAPEQKSPFKRQDWPLLTIPLIPGREYSAIVPIARCETGPKLSRLHELILRAAFVFQPVRKERHGIRVENILGELEADAREAAAKSNVSGFERAYKSLVGMHELLLGACLDKGESDGLGSWAMLPDVDHFFERRLYENWANSYRSVFLAAINAMNQDTRPILRLCHLLQHLDGPEIHASPVEVREHLLKLPPLMMFLLSQWWTSRIEEQGVMEHGHHRMVVLQAPTHRTYEEVVSTFVSGWESSRDAISPVPDASEEFSWSVAPTILRLTTTHIQETARMLLAAVSRGDRTAAEWFADALSKWWGQFDFDHEPYQLYGKTDYLTVEHLSLDWETLSATLGLSQEAMLERGELKVIQRGIMMAALKNFWIDIRLLTIELLIYWTATDDSPSLDDSLAIEIAAGFLVGKQWRAGGTPSESLVGLSAHDYFVAKVRQYASDGNFRGGYVGRLSNFVERIKDMERPSMVGSRIYSFNGADDVGSLQEAQLILLAVLSNSDWSIGESLRRQIDIWLANDYDCITVLKNRLSPWLDRLNGSEELPVLVVKTLLVRTAKPHSPGVGRTRAEHGVASAIKFIETKRDAALAAAPVATERLLELAHFASKRGFGQSSGDFPIQLFETLDYSGDDLEDFTLIVNQVRKGELTRVEMEQRAANEGDYWSDTMANRVAAIVLNDVLDLSISKEVGVNDADSYWATLKHESARIAGDGGHAILILDNATRPEWVWQWQHADFEGRYQRPADLRVQRAAGRGEGYVCDFNEIEVYAGPLRGGQSVLLAKECFKRIVFRKFGADRFVEVSYSERSDSKQLVDLEFRFSRKVETSASSGVRIFYSAPPRAGPTD